MPDFDHFMRIGDTLVWITTTRLRLKDGEYIPCDNGDALVKIAPKVVGRERRVTIIHELLHVAAELSEAEEVVDQMAGFIHDVMVEEMKV